MPKFYATFGVQYSEVPHPVLPPELCNPDGVMAVIAPTVAVDCARPDLP